VKDHQRSPMTLELLQALHINLKTLHALYPLGVRQACKISGAPAPGCSSATILTVEESS